MDFCHSKNIALFWGQKRFQKTRPLDKNLNIGFTWTPCETEGFYAYFTTVEQSETKEISTFVSHIIPDSSEDDEASLPPPDNKH